MLFLTSILTAWLLTGYTGGFRQGDWVTYTDFRYVTSVTMDQTIVYFGTTGGVIRYDRFAEQWLEPLTVTDGLPVGRINNIAYDPDRDRLWVATSAGNAYYQLTFEEWYAGGEFPAEFARNDFNPRSYDILTTEFGYFYQNGYLQDLDQQQYQLTKGIEDNFDHLYVGTWGHGPVVINTRFRSLTMLPYGPYSGNITTVVKIGDELWMGDDDGDLSSGAISSYDTRSGSWSWFQPRYTDGLASARLNIAAGDIETVWLGTEYGITRYDKNDRKFKTFADNSSLPSVIVTSLAISGSQVFAGTRAGIGYFDKTKNSDQRKNKSDSNSTAAPDSVDNDDSSRVLAKSRFFGWIINDLEIIGDHLYVASDRGALRRPIDNNGKFEFLNTPDNTLSTAVINIRGAGDSLYFATDRDIVIINSRTEESSTVTDPSYSDRWRIRRIETDGANIWAATDIGLWKYRIRDGYTRLYTMADGMISDDIRCIVMDGDYLWIATPGGLIRFYWNDPGRID